MGREIITQRQAQATNDALGATMRGSQVTNASADTELQRLVKLIPAEIVAAYLTVQGFIQALNATLPKDILLWGVTLILTFITPFYLMRIEKVQNKRQLGFSTAAFLVWVFTLGGPFALYDWYEPVYGAIALPLFLLIAVVFTAEKSEMPPPKPS